MKYMGVPLLMFLGCLHAVNIGCKMEEYAITSSSTTTGTSTSATGNSFLLDDFEDGDLVNVNGGTVDTWNSGAVVAVTWSGDYSHTQQAGTSPGAMEIYQDLSSGDGTVSYLWNGSWESTSRYDMVKAWIRSASGTVNCRFFGQDWAWKQWNMAAFAADTTWQQVSSDTGLTGCTMFKAVTIALATGYAGTVYVDDIVLEEPWQGSGGDGIINPQNELLCYLGRSDREDHPDSPRFSWCGNGVKAAFEGTSMAVRFDSTNTYSMFNVIVDGDEENMTVLRMESGDHVYPVVSGLARGIHTVEVFRRNYCWFGYCLFKGMILDPGCALVQMEPSSGRKIEFYGDSITAGVSDVKEPGDSDVAEEDDPSRYDNFISYGAITARALDAEYSCIAKSGIALTTGWSETSVRMDDFFDQALTTSPDPVWDFSSWQADVVVVNLFQNDKGIYNRDPSNRPSFDFLVSAYKDFIKVLRGKYPQAHIFCVLGTMDSVVKWENEPFNYADIVVQAAGELKAEGDNRVYSKIFAYQNDSQVLADNNIPSTPGHPAAWHHRNLMADVLVPFIREKTGW